MRRIAPIASACALISVCVVAAGCGTTVSGVRREGPAPKVTMKTPATSPPAIASNPAALAGMVRRDTSVSANVRQDLTPCDNDDYPMDTDAGNLTAGDGPDLVVNITTCGDGLGIASYVYRMVGGKYQLVFADEHGPVYGSVENGLLQVVHEVFPSVDPVAYPTGEEASTYAWQIDHFVQTARSFTDYGAPSPTASPEPTSSAPVPTPNSSLLDPDLPTNTPSPSRSPQQTPGTTPAPTTPAGKGR